MTKSHNKEPLRWDVRAADVLAGRTRLNLAAFIGLVNEVNPTGRGKDKSESAARYAVKARLESLLVKTFADDIDVVREPEHPGVVSIRHRLQPQVACHAAVNSLDVDARAWVQRVLDVSTWEKEHQKPSEAPKEKARGFRKREENPDDPEDPEEMLEAAARAEAEYDYERAGRLYPAAFEALQDSRSAIALLQFYVDALAADGDALSVDPNLPDDVRAEPRVRALLALAAVRSGDEARGLEYMQHVSDPRGAEVFALLAKNALSRGDTSTAVQRLAEARGLDSSNVVVVSVASEIEKGRGAERTPHEAELAHLVQVGDDAKAAAKAAEILARWPESEVARRTARMLEVKRETAEGMKLVEQAEAARGRGETTNAIALFNRAARAPLDDKAKARVRHAIEEIEAAEAEHAAAQRVDQVAALFVGDDKVHTARALGAYVALEEPLRAKVRTRVTARSLEWADAMTKAGHRAVAVVDATIALEQATVLTETRKGTDAAAVRALLDPHERVLEDAPHAVALLAKVRDWANEERRLHAVEQLRAAEQALDAEDTEQARKLLERAISALGKSEHARVEAMKARLASSAERDALKRSFERALSLQYYSDARRHAEALAARKDTADPQSWLEKARATSEEARRLFRAQVFDVDAGIECSRGSHMNNYPPCAPLAVDLATGTLAMPCAAAAHAFTRVFSLETGRLVRCVHMVAPRGLHEPLLERAGDKVMFQGGSNGILELSLRTGEPLRWIFLRDENDMERRFSIAHEPVPGGRYLWVMHDKSGEDGHVIDLEGARLPRLIPGAENFEHLPGTLPPLVAATRNDSTLSIHEPSGSQISRYEFSGSVGGVVVHPAADGWVTAYNKEVKNAAGYADYQSHWVEMSPSGKILQEHQLPNARQYARTIVAVSKEQGMVFIKFANQQEVERVLALIHDPQSSPPSLRVAYEIDAGHGRLLVQDREGKRVYMVGELDDRVEIVQLGPTAPTLGARGPQVDVTPILQNLWDCTQPKDNRGTRARTFFMESFKWYPLADIRKHAQEIRASLKGDREGLIALFWGHALSDDWEGATDYAAWLATQFPPDDELEQVKWCCLVIQRKWQALVDYLQPMDPNALTEPIRKHRHHLLAAAYVAMDNLTRAKEHVAAGTAITTGTCKFDNMKHLTHELSQPYTTDGKVPLDLPAIRQQVAVAKSADAFLEKRDYKAVLALYERHVMWDTREAQCLARLATAHLALPTNTDRERLRKSLALAMYAEAIDERRVGYRQEILVPGATWPEERISEVGARALAWLAGPEGEPRGT